MIIDIWFDIAAVWLCMAVCFGIIAGTVFFHHVWVPVAQWPMFFAPVFISLGATGALVSAALFVAWKAVA